MSHSTPEAKRSSLLDDKHQQRVRGTIRIDLAVFFIREFRISRELQRRINVCRIVDASNFLTPNARDEVIDLICQITGIED